MTDTTEKKNFEILDEKTVQTIDYILRGLELGKFDETAKKVEFLGKLTGDQSPKYIAKLLERINTLEIATRNLEVELANERSEYQNWKIDIDEKLRNHSRDMRGIAGGLGYLGKPDPFGTDYNNNWDTNATEQFITEYKSKY